MSNLYGVLSNLQYKDISARLETLDFGQDSIWRTFFPFKDWPFTTFQTLIGASGNAVAADIIEYDASAPEKKRKKVDLLAGNIPKTAVTRNMNELDLLAAEQFKVMATDAAMNSLIDLVFDDIAFVGVGVEARLDWVVGQVLATTNLSLTKTNNNGKVTETAIDFQMPAANKRILKTATATRVWQTGTVAQRLPITDFGAIAAAARALGFTVNWALMNWDAYQIFATSTEVVNLAARFMGAEQATVAAGTAPVPSLEGINAMLRSQALPQIKLVDRQVIIETDEHAQTSTDIWTTKYVTFVPEFNVGDMYTTTTMEEKYKPPEVEQFKTDKTLVSIKTGFDPVSVRTKGELLAFPSWSNINRCIRLDTNQQGATGLD